MLSSAARLLPALAPPTAEESESNAVRLRRSPAENAADSALKQVEALGQRCKEGDVAAWTALFPILWPVLVTFINRLYHSLDPQDAEDVAQVSIALAIKGIDGFSGKGLFRAWLFGIASQQARALFRRKSAAKRGLALLVPICDAPEKTDPAAKSPADATAESDRAAILHRALEELPDDDRDLVQLHYFGELTFAEIATVRRMNPKTVCTRVTRSKEKLLALLLRSNLTRADG